MRRSSVRIKTAVAAADTSLTELLGVGPVVAALLLVVVLPDESPGTIRADVTDVLGASRVDVSVSVLSVDGVRRLQRLVDALAPTRPSGSAARRRK